MRDFSECVIVIVIVTVSFTMSMVFSAIDACNGASTRIKIEKNLHVAQSLVHASFRHAPSEYVRKMCIRLNMDIQCSWNYSRTLLPSIFLTCRPSAQTCPTAKFVAHQNRSTRALFALQIRSEQRQAVRDEFQQSGVVGMWNRQVHVPDHHVERHPPACLAANSGCCALHRKSAPSQHTGSRTRCAMVAKGIQGTATSAQAEREREWEAETPKEEHSEQS